MSFYPWLEIQNFNREAKVVRRSVGLSRSHHDERKSEHGVRRVRDRHLGSGSHFRFCKCPDFRVGLRVKRNPSLLYKGCKKEAIERRRSHAQSHLDTYIGTYLHAIYAHVSTYVCACKD